MKVIILAAGRGSRLENLTQNKPKCMCTVLGKTLIERCIETLNKAGFQNEDIGIVTGYKNDLINIPGITYFHNNKWKESNMVYSLLQAKLWLKSYDCLIVYSDIIFSHLLINDICKYDYPILIPYYVKAKEL